MSAAVASRLPSATTPPVPPVLPPSASGGEGERSARQTLAAERRPGGGAATCLRRRRAADCCGRRIRRICGSEPAAAGRCTYARATSDDAISNARAGTNRRAQPGKQRRHADAEGSAHAGRALTHLMARAVEAWCRTVRPSSTRRCRTRWAATVLHVHTCTRVEKGVGQRGWDQKREWGEKVVAIGLAGRHM